MTIQDQLKKIAEQIEEDSMLDEQAKSVLNNLIEGVMLEPTPANLKVLSTVLGKLADSHRYLSAINTLSSLDEDQE
jgi:hypothetical protein